MRKAHFRESTGSLRLETTAANSVGPGQVRKSSGWSRGAYLDATYTRGVGRTSHFRTVAVRLSTSRRTAPVAVAVRSPAKDAESSPALPLSALVERNYPELRRIAVRELRTARLAHTMSPTSLVSESVVRLMRQRAVPAESAHLLGLATILMVQALCDRAKLRRAAKRGRRLPHYTITADVHRDRRSSAASHSSPPTDASLAAMHHQLIAQMSDLMRTHPRMMEIVTLHLVLDVPMPRVAELLGISERTCYRECGEGRRKLAARLARDEA